MSDWVLNKLLGCAVFMKKRFAIALMVKSSDRVDYQNGLYSRGIQLRNFLLDTYKYFNLEVCQ